MAMWIGGVQDMRLEGKVVVELGRLDRLLGFWVGDRMGVGS